MHSIILLLEFEFRPLNLDVFVNCRRDRLFVVFCIQRSVEVVINSSRTSSQIEIIIISPNWYPLVPLPQASSAWTGFRKICMNVYFRDEGGNTPEPQKNIHDAAHVSTSRSPVALRSTQHIHTSTVCQLYLYAKLPVPEKWRLLSLWWPSWQVPAPSTVRTQGIIGGSNESLSCVRVCWRCALVDRYFVIRGLFWGDSSGPSRGPCVAMFPGAMSVLKGASVGCGVEFVWSLSWTLTTWSHPNLALPSVLPSHSRVTHEAHRSSDIPQEYI